MRSEAAGPVRFGVLGCASFARRRMLPALAASPDARLVAVASRDRDKATETGRRFGCAAVLGYESLLASSGIEAVYVPLPSMLHAEWVRRALDAGRHVLVEKPLAADHATTARLLRHAGSRGLVLMENMAFPHHAQHTAARKLLADGAIGELRDFSSAFTIPPLPEDDNRYLPDVGGGALLDMGVYPIRAALHYLGPDLEVAAAVLRHHRGTGAVTSGRILAHTPGGVTADLHFGMEHSYRTTCEFAGSTGRLGLDRAFTPPPDLRPVARVERQDHREEITLPADDQFATVISAFARAVRSGRAGRADGLAEAGEHQARLVTAVEEKARRFGL
ncbi:Gfo/Idh/MocA family oxidoreductase [Actinomadura graeca]|uniref:Gfo/Idh/MocA family oxidoreductase n=1 Tax=Actinomadura graeca TaxID=2750812 RepID=A0ABX8R5N9_9ACTN|nr:Gfo/Idh/MocA family oxidoreductase [Actinomadura graeca]QXJ26148.1 Gfo/Idh/MocA family oxidoreductase [Actinomadura graeca]